VHNLRRIEWSQPDGAFDWNRRFDADAATILEERPGDVLSLADHPDFERAVPTPDHFIPLLHIAALASEAGVPAHRFVDGYAYGSLSMACYCVDHQAAADASNADDAGGAPVPNPADVPAVHTNL
jgi:4,5-DOPA dioxygenase extradiol